MIYNKLIKKGLLFGFIVLISQNILPVEVPAKVYTCKKEGYVIYQDTPCERVVKINKGMNAFDNWHLGISINEMKSIAKQKRLPMAPGSISYVSGYNKKILNSKPDERIYIYNTKFLGQHTKVKLLFTKTTQKLYRLEVDIYAASIKREERKLLYEKLYEQLCKKYGKPKKADTDLVKSFNNTPSGIISKQFGRAFAGKLFLWKQGNINEVTLNYKKNYSSLNFYKLSYTDVNLYSQNDRETTKVMKSNTTKAIQIDSSRL